jgi:hypothetical protein
VLDRGDDPCALLGDRSGELDERGQAAAPRPLDPAVEQRDRGVGGQPVDLAELLFEQVGAVERPVGALDV